MDRNNWDSAASNRRRGAFVAGVIIFGSSGSMIAGPLPGEPIAIDPPARPVQAGQDAAQPVTEDRGPTVFEELNAALAAARAKLDELKSAAEIAAITDDLRTELRSAKEENRRLADELEQARSALEATRAQLDEADVELEQRAEALRQRSAREEALVEAAEQSAAQVTRLRETLVASQDRLATVERKHQETQTRVAELKEALSGALADAAQLRKRLSDAENALSAAEEERDAARAASKQVRGENERLEQRLAAARAQADRLGAERARMEERLALLQKAADTATSAARANLLAMEDKIVSLNTALADVRRQESATDTASKAPSGGSEGTGRQRELQSVRASAATVPASPPATPATVRKAVAARDNHERLEPELEELTSDPSPHSDGRSLARVTAALPLEERMQVQALLADLKAEPEARGLRLTVPGGQLFATNSDQVQETAHETLAKVAEVIDIYDGHDVLITGHTDAMGEAAYNEMLSERRAALVKAFFVDNFAIDDARLLTRGLGEEQPIASNATLEGRRANRRVEVLILD